MTWILILAIIGIIYYVMNNKESIFPSRSTSSQSNTISSSNHSSTQSETINGNTFPSVPTDAVEAIKCLAELFEDINSKLSYLHMPSEIHLDFSQPKGSNVARLFIWYFKDYDDLGDFVRRNYTLSNGFSVSKNTIEYHSESITGFRKNMNFILDVLPCYYTDATLDYDSNPTGYSDYNKEYFAHGVYRV